MTETMIIPVTTLAKDPFTDDCPSREVFNYITGWWALLILTALAMSRCRSIRCGTASAD